MTDDEADRLLARDAHGCLIGLVISLALFAAVVAGIIHLAKML